MNISISFFFVFAFESEPPAWWQCLTCEEKRRGEKVTTFCWILKTCLPQSKQDLVDGLMTLYKCTEEQAGLAVEWLRGPVFFNYNFWHYRWGSLLSNPYLKEKPKYICLFDRKRELVFFKKRFFPFFFFRTFVFLEKNKTPFLWLHIFEGKLFFLVFRISWMMRHIMLNL